jgi:flagellar biosynthesis protein FlhG
MNDQADTLRRIMQQREDEERAEFEGPTHAPARHVITFSSGKGGTGKSVLAANLGALLARSGLRVMLVDGDFGLANLDLILNVQPHAWEGSGGEARFATLEDVLEGQAQVQEAVVGIEPNLWLLPARSGLSGARLRPGTDRAMLARLFERFPWEMDVLLVDLGPGISESVVSMHSPEFSSVVILTPEPTALADAYGLIKLLRRERGVVKVSVIVNRVTDAREALLTFQKLRDVAARFVDVQLEYLGHCPEDEKFVQSVMKRKILLDLSGEVAGTQSRGMREGSPAVAALELLSKRLRSGLESQEALSARPFWKNLLGVRLGETGEGARA